MTTSPHGIGFHKSADLMRKLAGRQLCRVDLLDKQ